jgi:membrane-bound lytic murein transglycosylase B
MRLHSKIIRQTISALFLVLTSCSVLADPAFDVWLSHLQEEAIESGVSIEASAKAVQKIQFLPEVVALDRGQPEFISPFLEYYRRRVTTQRVEIGQEKLSQYHDYLSDLTQQYGVPGNYLIAFWGMETHYGSHQGNLDVLSSLATLAYEGRRAEFFKQQLMQALKIADQQQHLLARWQGSWAGAFGHMQFMPSTYAAYATDGDADGVVDLIQSEEDAFHSAAKYLSKVGWQKNQPAILEVVLPSHFAMQDAQLNIKKPLSEWSKLGVKAMQGKKIIVEKTRVFQKKRRTHTETFYEEVNVMIEPSPLAEVLPNQQLSASIVLPQGYKGPAFLVFDNFQVIMDWNRSINYALSVAQLAQRLDGQMPFLAGEQAEKGALSFVQMQNLQIMLNQLGFDAGEPDGLPGLKTQAAIRQYQLSQNLPADGYASLSLYYLLDMKASVATQ